MAENNAIGWIGLGKMGVPMAGHLLNAGFALTVNSRSSAPVAALCDAGAEAAASPAAVAEKAEVIISMTSDDTALADVSTGPNGVFTTAAPGTLFIDMSTVSPDISARVAARAGECGIGFLRAPVSGGVALAVAGKLTVLASGARADFKTAEPLFDAMAKKSFYVGSGEEARYIKLALNMMVGMTSAMMGEALVFAERGGAARDTILDVMGESAIASPLVGYKLEPMRKRDFSATFSARQMAKDFDLLLGAARHTDTPLPLAALVRQMWSSMIASGAGEEDFLAYVKTMEALSGMSRE
ncbi:MAG: NAD(P)-dependent oxidoreductase [Alphaproteobacteria bacterium]|jgi:3-hydroxyisobutyrate dehydrogenase-like beta-hydroxyacid dehydrogenase|nr:NAD(P)-dependent oxidoreductase [Alphaproteobacteria bacterium]MDP6591229.1 NAD(P)-dependent oxidoreductase [Alphaproteobacteria bacterium]MDP6817756.1 NAD(P)-dependent oxidoreductase [Alphaproteobacteria bacterium]